MLNKYICFTFIFLVITRASYAEIIDTGKIRLRDEFVDVGRLVSNDGVIYVVINNGMPAVRATFLSKLPPNILIDLYNEYLEKKGVKEKLKRCDKGPRSVIKMMWEGKIDDCKKRMCILYVPQSHIAIINVFSQKKNNDFKMRYKSLINYYPEFRDLGGVISNSYEEVRGRERTGIFIYEVSAGPKSAFKKAVKKLEDAGWKVTSKSEDNNLCFMNCKNARATITANYEGGGTSLVNTVTAGF